MLEFIVYLLLPTLVPLGAIYFLWIRRFGLERRAVRLAPKILVLALATDFLGEIGVYVLRPWFFDCAKTVGCIGGVPLEDLLVALLIWFDVALATLAFVEIKKMSRNRTEFLEYLLLLRKAKK